LLKFPLVFGRVKVICERDLSIKHNNIVVSSLGGESKKAEMNLLKLVNDLPQGMANELTDEELEMILGYYVYGHRFFNALESFCRNDELVESAREDITASARAGVGNTKNYGQSLWLSLQAAEKLLKYYIKKADKKYPHTHDLSQLMNMANKIGLPFNDKRIIELVQCDAKVRYEKQSCHVTKIINANQSAVIIGSSVMNTLYGERFSED